MTETGQQQKADNDLVLSFLAVRRAIGALGYFLPVALLVYGLFSPSGLLTSMSASYYSPMRDVFVGTLCAQAVFLWSYEGFRLHEGEWISDKVTARVAAAAVALIALAPTTPGATMTDTPACTLLQCLLGQGPAAIVHLLAAGIFFAALAVFCLVLFVRGQADIPEKRASNRIYRTCGWLIVISIATIGILVAAGLDVRLAALRPVFWLEVLATCAFATSWAVKGDSLRPLVRMVQTRL